MGRVARSKCLFLPHTFNNILINDTYRSVAGILMFGGIQSLAESKIGRFRIEEGIGLVYIIQGAATERHH